MFEPVKFHLHVASPIHIGCDEIYEPMSFVIDEESRKLIELNPFEFLESLGSTDKAQFMEICRRGSIESILELYHFMRRKRPKSAGPGVDTCSGVVEHYKRTLNLQRNDRDKIKRELNRFIIGRTAFNPNSGRPVIPGSAIKGALRTAYLNRQSSTKSKERLPREGKSTELERRLLDGGSFDSDPFRMLKVSDFSPVGEVKTRIVYAINRKKKPSGFEAKGPPQILEIIEPGAWFEGTISLTLPEKRSGIAAPLTFDGLIRSATAFYSEEMSRENNELSTIGISPFKPENRKERLLLRLGRHSGAECLTIKGYRQIKIMQGKGQRPRIDDHATTLWLSAESNKVANNERVQPFGWAALNRPTDEEAKAAIAAEQQYQAKKRANDLHGAAVTQNRSSQGAPAEHHPAPAAEDQAARRTVWPKATLGWSPGNQILSARSEKKKATCKGKDMVPQALHEKLFVKKKEVVADVEVEPVGNAFKIVGVKPI